MRRLYLVLPRFFIRDESGISEMALSEESVISVGVVCAGSLDQAGRLLDCQKFKLPLSNGRGMLSLVFFPRGKVKPGCSLQEDVCFLGFRIKLLKKGVFTRKGRHE
ncbi:MAG TPA: hypothetical protein VKP03_00240 [Patescibacteria group bacterium]|nr:hypothetical protein [Patescibacteria group bacterium]